MNPNENVTRRTPKTRNTKWAAFLATSLVTIRIKPNQISLASIFFAAMASAAFIYAGRAQSIGAGWLLLLAVVGIQLRLRCNMLAGMVAGEGGLRSKTGELYNEISDRCADALILIGAGYSHADILACVTAGWLAAVMTVITAYVRALGVVAGASQCYHGPMAKSHRMAVLTAASVLTAFGAWAQYDVRLVPISLWVIIAGCAVTMFRRCRQITRELEAKNDQDRRAD